MKKEPEKTKRVETEDELENELLKNKNFFKTENGIFYRDEEPAKYNEVDEK